MSTEVTAPATETPNAAATPNNEQPAAAQPAPEVKATPEVQAPVVPEKYELKLAEKSLLDPSYVEKVSSYAKEKKLTQEQAQEVLNREQDVVKSYFDKQIEKFEQTKEAWKQEAMTDSEIGGEGFTKNVELAHRALEKFSSPKFMQELESTGYGNHPELVRVFARIGKLIGEDTMKMPGTQTGGQRSYEDIFYGQKS